MSKQPVKKTATTNKPHTSPTKKTLSKDLPTNPPKKTEQTEIPKVEAPLVKMVKLQAVVPRQMQALQGLSQWPIIMDDTGNAKTFYRVNELIIDFVTPLTKEQVQIPLQRAFFGLSFNPDGSIQDHRTFTIPNDVNRLITLSMNDRDIGQCIEELKRVCGELHPQLFQAVFEKVNPKETGPENVDHLFVMTQTPEEIRQADYYQFGARNRCEVPFMCVWMTQKTEIPAAYDHLFGPRFHVI